MNKPIRIIAMGLGAIGIATVRLALTKKTLRLVGAVDADPTKAGRDLGAVLGLPQFLGMRVEPKLSAKVRADAVVLTTGSRLDKILPQLETIARAGWSCVSSCEELFFPHYRHAKLATRLDLLAKKHRVALVGTGVNPGFVMDVLPMILSGVAQRVDSIHVTRIVDLGQRRVQLQQKIGLGLTPEEFQRRADRGAVGHVGLIESAAFLADALDWKLEHITQHIEPIIARKRLATAHLQIPPGRVVGMNQTVRGGWHSMDRIRLDLQMRVAPSAPRDEILLEGEPRLRLILPGGIRGDEATAAILLNTLPGLLAAPAGLRIMRELGAPRILQMV